MKIGFISLGCSKNLVDSEKMMGMINSGGHELVHNADAAEAFLDEFADVLSEIAHIHSFMDMEGSFSVSFEGEHIAYDFRSEPGDGMCDFIERKEN